MKRGFAAIMPVLLLLLTAGCISVDYVGQSFPPLPDNHAVLFFNEHNPVPPGMYQTVGHADVTIPKGVDSIAIREKLSDFAREHGASAVQIVKTERQLVNSHFAGSSSGERSMISSRSSLGALSLQPDGTQTGVNSFGDVVQNTRTYRAEYRTVMKVLMMMTVKDYEQAIAKRRDAAEWVPAEETSPAKPGDKVTDKVTDKTTDKTIKP